MRKSILIFFFAILLSSENIIAQENTITVSGFVTDKTTGEVLVGSNILLYKDSISTSLPPIRGVAANSYGYYAIPNITPGRYFLITRYVGYRTEVIEFITGENNLRIDPELMSEEVELGEIVIQAKREDKAAISTIQVDPALLEKLPSFSGEVELFKSLQFLPGVKVASETSSGLYIRGGSPDQTLVLVDGMIIYNPAHLGNFTTTFNSNALQDVKLIKGAFPAEYGGRLSSVLDIKLRSGTKEKDIGTLGVGGINSHVNLEGPLSDNSTYMVSGRWMYYDLFQESFAKESTIPRYHFYDANLKLSYNLSESDILSISGMYTKDNLYNPSNSEDIHYDVKWENGAININWLQIASNSFFSNTTLSYINYKFNSIIENDTLFNSAADFYASSKLQDFNLRKTFEFYLNENHTINSGVEVVLHNYKLITSNFYNPLFTVSDNIETDLQSLEASIFVQDEIDITPYLSTNIGGRAYYFRSTNYYSFEPRISAAYYLLHNLQFKAAFATAHQFLHLIVRNDISLPTDFWYPSTKNIKPGKSNQYVAGLNYNFSEGAYTFALEGYYKDFKNLYEFKENASFDLYEDIDQNLTEGEGEAYGIEFFVNKGKGNLNGWIGYTLAWTKRLFPEINHGKIFYPRYDRRHDISLVLVYEFNKSFSMGLTWNYATGQGYTMYTGQFQFGDILDDEPDIRFNQPERNAYRLPDYHKLDLNFTYKFNWNQLPLEAYLNIYNVYNRQNAYAQYLVSEEDPDSPGKKVNKLKQLTLFPFIPTVGIKLSF